MADTAVFSSFRRPAPQPTEPVADLPREAPPAPDLPADFWPPGLPAPGRDADLSDGAWADLTAIPVDSDQLGLAHPDVIALVAHLPGCEPVALAADTAGLYRPPSFRAAPWSGFGYDMMAGALTGLAAGTRILTARGEIEVERLQPGDAALALRGPALLPISWIGRSIAASPAIRIEPGALGPDIPRRALHLGPDQSVFVDPVPVAAKSLVNGTTIREADGGAADLFHVDLGVAEILLAEGIPLSSSHRAILQGE